MRIRIPTADLIYSVYVRPRCTVADAVLLHAATVAMHVSDAAVLMNVPLRFKNSVDRRPTGRRRFRHPFIVQLCVWECYWFARSLAASRIVSKDGSKDPRVRR